VHALENKYYQMKDDMNVNETISHEMVKYISGKEGSAGWYQLTNMVRLRRQQGKQRHFFDPTLEDLVFKLQNPYPEGTDLNLKEAKELAGTGAFADDSKATESSEISGRKGSLGWSNLKEKLREEREARERKYKPRFSEDATSRWIYLLEKEQQGKLQL